MTTALVLVLAAVLALVGGWGMLRLLALLDLDPAERFTVMLAIFPAALGLAAFAGLLAAQPGPLFPAALCVALGALGGALTGKTPPPGPLPIAMERGRRTGNAGTSVAANQRQNPAPTPVILSEASSPTPVILSEASSPPHVILSDASPLPPVILSEASLRAQSKDLTSTADLTRTTVLAVVLFAAGALGTTLLTPLSAGAFRIGDWVAHWFLVLVYLGQPLPDLRVFTNRVGDFGVISRPPLYNLEGGLLVGALDLRFWPFQLITPLLAVAVVAAGVLWAHAVGGRRAARIAAPLIGLSPFLLQNAAYPWSKMVAAGLVLTFLLLIRAAALARRPTRARQTFVLAAVCAGLSYLAHQTSLFYVLPTLLWLVWRRPHPLFRRPAAWTIVTWAFGGLAGLAAFGPWQAWVLATYGLRAVLDANPASFGADVSESFLDWLVKGGVAALGTLVPLPALKMLVRGTAPTLDQLLRIQLAVLTGALGVSCCWLLLRTALGRQQSLGRGAPASPILLPAPRRRGAGGEVARLLRRPPWLALVVLCGFFGQVMLQPNWHETGDAAESMTPIVILGLAYAAGEAGRLGPGARRLFFALVLVELACYLGLWLTWAFGAAWTRDVNAVLGSRYGLDHIRGLWEPAVPLGAALLTAGLGASAARLWRALRAGRGQKSTAAAVPSLPDSGRG